MKELEKKFMIWMKDPVLFVKEVLKVKRLESWQEKALVAIANNDHVSIRSGHGVGKSAYLAWVILWWVMTRSPSKCGCTAPTAHQLEDVLWGEVFKWWQKMDPEFKALVEIKSDKIEMVLSSKDTFVVARTARKEKPEAFQGLHDSNNMLFIIDEASGVDNVIFQVAEGAMSTAGAKTVMTGNPTRTTGYFFDTFNKRGIKEEWVTFHVPCQTSTQVTTKYIENMKRRYGEDSNVYRVRVLGEFPEEGDDILIPLSKIQSAIGREVEVLDTEPVIWGLDVARMGWNKNALAKRKGRILLEKIQTWSGKDSMQTVGRVYEQYQKVRDFPKEKPVAIMVDVIGVGGPVMDRMREMGLPAIGVNVAEVSSMQVAYHRLRDQLWFSCRDWFLGMDVRIPDDEDFIDETSNVKYFYLNGKLKAESKDQMRERGVDSPDRSDAFNLTFAPGAANRSPKKLDYPDLGIV